MAVTGYFTGKKPSDIVSAEDTQLEAKMKLRRMQANLTAARAAGEDAKVARLEESIAKLKQEAGIKASKKPQYKKQTIGGTSMPRGFARSATKPHQHHLLTDGRKES